MDQALYASLSRYDACLSARNAQESGGGSHGTHGSNGGGGSGQGTASADMSGSEGEQRDNGLYSDTPSSMSGSEAGQSTATTDSGASEGASPDDGAPATATDTVHAMNNGSIPEDIPPADNDSVLEAQIRQAAMHETDPVKRERLWNEYRKYKGLPRPSSQ